MVMITFHLIFPHTFAALIMREKNIVLLLLLLFACFNSGEKLKILPTVAAALCLLQSLSLLPFLCLATAFIFLLLLLFNMFQTHTVCFTFKKCERTQRRRRCSFIFYDNLFTFSSSIILSPYVHDDVNFSFSCYLLLLPSTTSQRKWLIVS